MSGAEAPHLAIRGIAKRFGDFAALAGVELGAARGEFVSLLGPSGCGKTTLLRVIAGFLRQDSGEVVLGGRRIDQTPPEGRNFGMVFQNYAVFPHLSVFDNVAYGLVARRVAKAEIARRVPAALKRVRLDHLAQRYPDAMSGGQKQRVGLARAMVIEPDLLLMDEPLSNLDAKLRIEMRQEIRLMQRELGITTIYVTHDQEEALAISDRIAVMDRGRILQVGAPREIFERPAHAFVADFVGGCNWFEGTLAGGVVSLAAGPRFAAAGRPCAVRVALRTEELRLALPSDDPAQCFAGRVTLLAYLGARTRVTLATPGGPLHADIPSDSALPAEGAEASLAFDPRRAACFSAEDGARLA